jgi:hypothetical protein
VLVLLTGALLYTKGRAEIPTGMKPSGALKEMMDSAALSTDPRTIVSPGSEAGEAGKHYRSLAAAVAGQAKDYDTARRSLLDAARSGLSQAGRASLLQKQQAAASSMAPALSDLIAGAKCKDGNLFAGNPAEVVNYTPFENKPVLPTLQIVGNFALDHAATLAQANPDSSEANDLRRAVFQLGRLLYEERPNWRAYEVGLELMSGASMRLRTAATDPAEKTKLEGFARACETNLTKFRRLAQDGLYQIPMEGQIWPKTGDVMEIAQKSNEPMWRAQATLRLGVLKGIRGVSATDQAICELIIDSIAAKAEEPANVRAAAAAAKNISSAERQRTDRVY